ncbi:MAG TPA: phosphoribosylglycinamide formyltransferase, partial [Candidatus Dormibacteraeota bacterium]
AAARPDYPARVVGVASNRPACPGLDLARSQGVPARAFPISAFAGDLEARDEAIAGWLRALDARLVALAGYDRIVTAPLLRSFPGRILNLHNSLLPAFAGTMNAVQEALDHGVKLTGCTVHLVDEDHLDGGPIVLQAAVPVEEGDTEASLLQRIHEQEWRILPEAIALLAVGQVRVEGRRVVRTGAPA